MGETVVVGVIQDGGQNGTAIAPTHKSTALQPGPLVVVKKNGDFLDVFHLNFLQQLAPCLDLCSSCSWIHFCSS